MEAAAAAGTVSAVVGAVVNKALSYGFDFLGARSELKKVASRLQGTLRTIKATIQLAEQQSSWLSDLKDAVYEAEAVLDEIEYERLKRQVNKFNPTSIFFEISILPRVRDIELKLSQFLSTASNVVAIIHRNQTASNSTSTRETSSLAVPEQLFGRGAQEDHVIQWLLDGVKKPLETREGSSVATDTSADNHIPVLSIYGMGGIGKTALAQHIFHNETVKSRFDLRVWVYVSENFNCKKIIKDILQSVEHETHQYRNPPEFEISQNKPSTEFCDILDVLEQKLIRKLAENQTLIVLDDVWNNDKFVWDELRKCIKYGKPGSKIMATCRSKDVAELMATPSIEPLLLQGLEMKDFWLLFKNYAIRDQSTSSTNSIEFDNIGRQIAAKLKGSPLAAKTVGRMLSSKSNIEDWRKVLNSDLWKMEQNEGGIMDALMLSYQHLPDYLKPCFTYISLIPKGWKIRKNLAILRWIAQGFVQIEDSEKTMFSVGTEYMDELLDRSLIQQQTTIDGFEQIGMHDLIHDMARKVTGNDIYIIKDNKFTCIPRNVRHLSIFSDGSQLDWIKIRSELKINLLHSLVIDGRNDKSIHAENKGFMSFLNKILSKGKNLKVLSLENLRLRRIPSSIRNLKLLRYLSLLCNPFTTLPNSLASLYHMQTLDIVKCDNLEILPPKMKKLINLSHFMGDKNLLDITCLLRLMIVDLLIFKVQCTREHTINVLGVFNDVRRLVIQRLENVSSKEEAMEAKLKEKKGLEVLKMEWSSGASSSSRRSNDEEVLEGLQPSSRLERLWIMNYQGVGCPSWMTGHDLPNLRDINCHDCSWLLEISTSKNLQESIRKIWLENCGQLQGIPLLENNNFFPRPLETLCIRNCGEFGNSLQQTHLVHLKFLKALHLRGCTRIEYLPTNTLPSLEKLEVLDCKMLSTKEGMGGLDALASLIVLRIYECHKLLEDLVMTSGTIFPSSLKQLYISDFSKEIFFPASVRRLQIYRSKNLESLPIEVFLTVDWLKISACLNLYPPRTTTKQSYLKHFEIWDTSLTSVKEWLQFLKSSQLNGLIIGSISELQSFDSDLDGMLDGLPALTHLRLVDLPNLQSLPSKLHEHLRSLRFLEINNCPRIKSLSASMFAPCTELEITYCPQLLKRLPKKWFVEIEPSRYLVNPATTTA